MNSFPTPDLVVRPGVRLDSLNAGDAARLVEIFQDSELRRWLPLPDPYTPEMAIGWCTDSSETLRTSGRGLVTAVRVGDTLVASLDVKRVDWRARTAEISYWTAQSSRGRGLMTASVRVLAEWMLTIMRFERIELRVAPGNRASRRVAEKAGFREEGISRNAGFTDAARTDLVIYSLIPEDLS